MITQSLVIPKALRLKKQIVDNLLQGKSIAAIPRTYINVGDSFALYPEQVETNTETETVSIEAWARCEFCDIINGSKSLEIVSHYVVIPVEDLQKIITERESFFLICLRVYQLPTAITIPTRSSGQYIPLPERIQVNEASPILGDRDFYRLKQQLENLEPPEPLDIQIQRILRETELQNKIKVSQKLNWIQTISTLGDRSIELEEKKNTYQAGTDFENIAKQGLEFLGFTIDESHKGGAGGLDLFCSNPYPLTGECKAGKSIPNGTVGELIRLGGTHLGVDGFINLSAKLVIGAGKPAKPMLDAAHEWKVSIIKAMTLQKLVELKAKYDGAINLFELKDYLQAGQIDEEIDKYIQKVEDDIKVRSHIVQTVKEEAESNMGVSVIEIRATYNAKYARCSEERLNDDDVKDLLIELSSPLAGYLGRIRGDGGKGDHFYFLRDLKIK